MCFSFERPNEDIQRTGGKCTKASLTHLRLRMPITKTYARRSPHGMTREPVLGTRPTHVDKAHVVFKRRTLEHVKRYVTNVMTILDARISKEREREAIVEREYCTVINMLHDELEVDGELDCIMHDLLMEASDTLMQVLPQQASMASIFEEESGARSTYTQN